MSGLRAGDVDGEIVALARVRDAAGDRLGALAAREVGRLARRELPEARIVVLRWRDPVFTSPVTFLDAEGRDVGCTPAGQQLIESVRPYCEWLDEANTGGWGDASVDPPDGYVLGEGQKLLDLSTARRLAVPPGPFVAAPPARLPGGLQGGPALEA